MDKPRIIVADLDVSYLIPLQASFAAEYGDKIRLELITDERYFADLFSKPQQAEMLIVSEDLYDKTLEKHQLGRLFILTEKQLDKIETEGSSDYVYKYTNIRDVFLEITRKSWKLIDKNIHQSKGSQIVAVYSAAGGTGKTTIAVGLAAYLGDSGYRVLYINADRLQHFQWILDDQTSIQGQEIYRILTNPPAEVFREIRYAVRKEVFDYLPPFKAPLTALGIPYDVFRKIATDAKLTQEYDYIILDTDSVFDEEKTRILGVADKVVIVTAQSASAVCATDLFAHSVNDVRTEKYIFLCNDNSGTGQSKPGEQVEKGKYRIQGHIDYFKSEKMTVDNLLKEKGIQDAAILIM